MSFEYLINLFLISQHLSINSSGTSNFLSNFYSATAITLERTIFLIYLYFPLFFERLTNLLILLKAFLKVQ